MGLAERKAVAAAKETDFKKFEEKMRTWCGNGVKLTFDWTALENDPNCEYICTNKRYNDNMFDVVSKVFETVCADKMGKEAVNASVKEVQMIPIEGKLEFKDGVLVIRSNLASGSWRPSVIQEILEAGL